MSDETNYSLSTPLRRCIERGIMVGYPGDEPLYLQDFLADLPLAQTEAIQEALSAHIVAMEYGNTLALRKSETNLHRALKQAKEECDPQSDSVVWATTIVKLINDFIDAELDRNDERSVTELQ